MCSQLSNERACTHVFEFGGQIQIAKIVIFLLFQRDFGEIAKNRLFVYNCGTQFHGQLAHVKP